MSPPLHASWQNPRVLTTLLLVFLCGALAGALVMRYGVHPAVHQAPPAWTEGGREISLHRFEKELDLTPEQSREMERILDDFMMYYHTLQSQMDEVRGTGKERILRTLNEDQKKRFEGMLQDLQSKELR
jgi:hypothetical protein